MPQVPTSPAIRPRVRKRPAVRPAGIRSPNRNGKRSRVVRQQQPGASACTQGTLPRGFKALGVTRGVLTVIFGGKGVLRVSVARSHRATERRIYRKRFAQSRPGRRVRIRPKDLDGSWFVRVRALGGCHQSTKAIPF